jgi:hypothetical protein
MKAISKDRKAVREALAQEGWRFSLVSSLTEFNQHRNSCRTLTLPAGNESDNRIRTIREALLRPVPWEFRSQPLPRWLSYISRPTRRRLQLNLPIGAAFCLAHGFIFLLGEVWAERNERGWRVHRSDGPALILEGHDVYFWRGWQVSKAAVMNKPTVERILAEENQTEREVLLQRMGVESFMRQAELKPVDNFRDSALLKVDTAAKRGTWRDSKWTEIPLQLAFLKVMCPSTQKTYFLRVDPEVETAKQALESTLPGYTRDWERDLVAET